MIQETKIYSDFIKKNNAIVSSDYFSYNGTKVYLYKSNNKWFAGEQDGCYTKKAAIYWYIKNNF